MSNAGNELVNRGRNIGRHAYKQVATVNRLDRIVNEFLAKVNTHNNNPHLSDAGKRINITRDAESYVRQLGLAAAAIERHRNAPEQLHGALVKKAFAEFENDPAGPEIRAVLRQMSHGEIVKEAAANPRIAAAITLAPSILCKIESGAIAHVVDAHLQKNHSADLAKIENVKEGVEIAESMLTVATDAFRGALKLSTEHAFQQFLKSHGPTPADVEVEAKGDVPVGVRKLGIGESVVTFNSDVAANEAA